MLQQLVIVNEKGTYLEREDCFAIENVVWHLDVERVSIEQRESH